MKSAGVDTDVVVVRKASPVEVLHGCRAFSAVPSLPLPLPCAGVCTCRRQVGTVSLISSPQAPPAPTPLPSSRQIVSHHLVFSHASSAALLLLRRAFTHASREVLAYFFLSRMGGEEHARDTTRVGVGGLGSCSPPPRLPSSSSPLPPAPSCFGFPVLPPSFCCLLACRMRRRIEEGAGPRAMRSGLLACPYALSHVCVHGSPHLFRSSALHPPSPLPRSAAPDPALSLSLFPCCLSTLLLPFLLLLAMKGTASLPWAGRRGGAWTWVSVVKSPGHAAEGVDGYMAASCFCCLFPGAAGEGGREGGEVETLYGRITR